MSNPPFVIAASLIGWTAVLDIAAIILLVFHGGITKEVYALIGTILGVWHAGFVGAWGYWIGSSHASQAKDETIARLSSK